MPIRSVAWQSQSPDDTALLDRRMRPAILTEAGQILLLAVTDGLDQFGRAIDQIIAMQAAQKNVVTVGCAICTGTYWLDNVSLRAVQGLPVEGIHTPILVGRPDVIAQRLDQMDLQIFASRDFEIVNPEQDPRYDDYWRSYHDLILNTKARCTRNWH